MTLPIVAGLLCISAAKAPPHGFSPTSVTNGNTVTVVLTGGEGLATNDQLKFAQGCDSSHSLDVEAPSLEGGGATVSSTMRFSNVLTYHVCYQQSGQSTWSDIGTFIVSPSGTCLDATCPTGKYVPQKLQTQQCTGECVSDVCCVTNQNCMDGAAVACSAASLVFDATAASRLCPHGECTTNEAPMCCSPAAPCTDYRCPIGYEARSEGGSKYCSSTECTSVDLPTCCSTDRATCATMSCGNTYTKRSNAEDRLCAGARCYAPVDRNTCCQRPASTVFHWKVLGAALAVVMSILLVGILMALLCRPQSEGEDEDNPEAETLVTEGKPGGVYQPTYVQMASGLSARLPPSVMQQAYPSIYQSGVQ